VSPIADDTVVITGANRGLGLALARHYRAGGATVIAGCRNPSAATDLAAIDAEVHPLDTSSPESIAAFVAAVGDRPIDVLFNNAGIDARAVGATEAARSALELTAAQFTDVMNVNVLGPMLMVQGLAANLRAAAGKVVNVSSQVGSIEVAKRIGKDAAYTTSKAALNMLTLKQSQVLGPDGVTVIALHPGWLRSEMGGASADLDPADAATSIASVVEHLTTEQSGTFLRWDGTAHPW
jgi:NAD(P)-dependent dehydrogenase (short-subunit alcohol dehydrogenase family)